MSLLVISMPARERLGGRADGSAAPEAGLPSEWAFALADDKGLVLHAGRAPAPLLPRAERRVLVLAAADVAWQRLDIPKAPAALALLESAPGAPAIDAVVAALEPVAEGQPRRGHFQGLVQGGLEGVAAAEHDTAEVQLALATPEGVATLGLGGTLARGLVGDAAGGQWTATPAVAAAAERWLGAPVPVLPEAQALVVAATQGSNLRQFELVPRHRGTRALREGWRVLGSPAWRPVRWGLLALAGVQLLGLNAHAWQQRQRIADSQAQMVALLKQAHPSVPVVLDAPLQMQRETEQLRGRAGRAGPGDFEALLAAAALAWPDGVGPAMSLRFEPGRLTLAVPGWGDAQWQQFQQRLRAGGQAAEFVGGQVSIVPPAAPRRGGS